MQFAAQLTKKLGGPRIYLKREDLLHTGAHKINNAIGQGLLAVKMGKPRIIAETGAGQHGVSKTTLNGALAIKFTYCLKSFGVLKNQKRILRAAYPKTLSAGPDTRRSG